MRHRRTLLLALPLCALLLAGGREARACSCVPAGPPSEEAARARAVFAGEVVEVVAHGAGLMKKGAAGKGCAPGPVWQSAERAGSDVRVRFKVTKAWKNVTGGEVVVTTAANSAACGYSFAKGESYVVYAYGGEEGRPLTTSLCSRTRRLSDAAEDLSALGAGRTVSPASRKPRRKARRPARRRTA